MQHLALPAAPKPCLKRGSAPDAAASPAKRRVTIHPERNELKFVAYYGRPQHSPDLAKQCFYTEQDCACRPIRLGFARQAA